MFVLGETHGRCQYENVIIKVKNIHIYLTFFFLRQIWQEI